VALANRDPPELAGNSDKQLVTMMGYSRTEAKSWAKEHMIGVCGSLLPTFTDDLHGLNERAIRHDVRRLIELGFWGALLISECGTTLAEYMRFMEIAADEAGDAIRLAAQNLPTTTEETQKAFAAAEALGLSAVLIGYPSGFFPRSEDQIFDYSKRLIDATNLAVILYSSQSWDFGALHPAQLSLRTVARLTDLPNVVAMKCEGGAPGTGSLTELVHHLGDRLLVSDSQEYMVPSGVKMYNMQWLGTSNYDCFGDAVVRYFDLLRSDDWDAGMSLFWKIHPARVARFENARANGAHVINRTTWKYLGWLNGMNGGPLRGPLPKLDARQAEALRSSLVRSGIIEPDVKSGLADFLQGRFPA
jgi:dihydrodipicolinate synthase/N-acetylneuraminate lyase